MKIKVNRIMKGKSNYSSPRETVTTSSIGACSFAMDDGGRCLLDVINDPLLLQSFLESGSDENSKDPQDGTSSESAVESPQVSRISHSALSNQLSNSENIVDSSDQMGYSYAVDQGLLAQSGVCSVASGLGGMSLIMAPSSIGSSSYQHVSSSGATIHHVPSTVAHTSVHSHSPVPTRSATPLSHSIKSPVQAPSSVQSMPPPSPLQQTRSPLPSHTPSPAPSWSPAPPVLSPATSRSPSVPSAAFQQSHNQILQTSCSVTQFVTALATQQSITQKLTIPQQQQQQLFLHQQLSPASHQSSSRLTTINSPVVTTTAVTVTPPVVQLISAPQSTVPLPIRTSHTVRPIQPKLPPQILPKPSGGAASQFVSPSAAKQSAATPVTSGQRTVGVGLQPGATSQLVIGQGQPGVFQGPQGTILLNQIIPGVGPSPILIQGNLSNLANLQGLQLTLRPPSSVSPSQSLSSSAAQNNATLIAALQGPSQHAQTLFAQTKSPIHGQQTIMIPNNIAHTGLTPQNLNLTSAAIPNSTMMSSSSQGQGFLARSNIILSPRMVGPNQGIQLQQIQTPNGPIFAFAPSQAIVPHLQTALQNAALGNSQLAPVTVPMHGVMTAGQGVLSSLSLQSHPPPPSALQQQSLYGAAVPFSSHLEQTSHQVIQVSPNLTQQVPSTHPNHVQNQPQIELSPKPASPPKPSKVPGVNLEELLKEHGIVPENSPPPSPDSNSPVIEDTVPPQMHVNSSVVPPSQLITALQSQQVVLEQLSQNTQAHSALPQLKFSLTQDGSVILQPHTGFSSNPRIQHYVSSGHIQGRIANAIGSVILPTVTTSSVSVPVVATESTTSRGHSALLAQLNASPAICVPDVMTSLAYTSAGGSTSSSITTTTITTTSTSLVPLTVQSPSLSNSPIASSYVMQRTTTPIMCEGVQNTDETICSSNHIKMPVASSSCTVQNIQNRINHVTSGCYQTIIVSSDYTNMATSYSTPKTVQSLHLVTTTSTNNSPHIVQPKLEKCGNADKHIIDIGDNNGAVVPSHNLQSFATGVPNQVLQKLQKEIKDLLTLKYRSLEQQKSLQELIAIQQKIIMQPKHSGKGCRANQNQMQIKHEAEILEKIIQRPSVNKTVLIAEHSQHQPTKTQPSHLNMQMDKQQTIPSSQTVHIVNLLKQNPQNVTVRHVTPVTTVSATTTCDSAITTVTTSTNLNTTHQRVCNQISTAPIHQQIALQQISNTPEKTQTQVIVRVQANALSQPITTCPNVGQVKGPTTVTRVKNAVPKAILFNEQLAKDQKDAVNPDVNTPFLSKADACKRLLKYHVYNSKVPSIVEIQKADETFDMVSVQLLNKVKMLKNKYHLLQLKESMRTCATPEKVLLERLFLEDEQSALEADKALVEEGKTLSLPPLPSSWLKDYKVSPPPSDNCSSQPKTEGPLRETAPADAEESNDPVSETGSDHLPREETELLYKEDSDNLEAPVIDSCADIVPQHDDNCERSPPTLKRIVIKPEKLSESDSEEPISRKRLKYHYTKSEPNHMNWECGGLFKSYHVKGEVKDDVTANHRYPHGNALHSTFQSDNQEEDIMSKIRKELNISPMEMDEDSETADSHVVDFDPSNGSNELADFEPPVARTDDNCESSLLASYNRSNSEMKYDFDLLTCSSEWTEAYANHVSEGEPSESAAAVESILVDHPHSSDLDLSGLDGLDDHMDEGRTGIPNGLQNNVREPELGYYRPAKQKRTAAPVEDHCGHIQDQVHSAIKSILEMRPENRSYYEETDSVPRGYELGKRPSEGVKHGDYRSLETEENVQGGEADADLDEAVRSILL